MHILYLGDIMGEPGKQVVRHFLPQLKREFAIDLTIAQAENVTDGKGLSVGDFRDLQQMGIDFCTGGNWTLNRQDLHELLNDPSEPVIRPANYPEGTPGLGAKMVTTDKGKVLIISLLGQIVGRDADNPMQNPLQLIDQLLKDHESVERVATIVNFHGDYSSEKRVIGYYLDGKVSAVIGDHWHVPTADALVLPKGAAHITDVGMCGSLHSSLGVKVETIVNRWRDGRVNRNEIETRGPLQCNAVVVEIDTSTGLAKSIQQVQRILEVI